MKAKQKNIMKEQIEESFVLLNFVKENGDLTRCFEGYPKKEHVEKIATKMILNSIDSAIKFVDFNEQDSYTFINMRNQLQERYDAFDLIYGEKVDKWAATQK